MKPPKIGHRQSSIARHRIWGKSVLCVYPRAPSGRALAIPFLHPLGLFFLLFPVLHPPPGFKVCFWEAPLPFCVGINLAFVSPSNPRHYLFPDQNPKALGAAWRAKSGPSLEERGRGDRTMDTLPPEGNHCACSFQCLMHICPVNPHENPARKG